MGKRNNNKGRNNKGRDNNFPRRPNQRNNFQDNAEINEYNKGFRAGSRDKKKDKDVVSGSVALHTGSSDNDPSWYTPNGQLVKDVASFPFGLSTGLPILRKPFSATDTNGKANWNWDVPGVMTFTIGHTIGTARTATDPINVALSALYSSIQAANSRTPVAEAPDYGMVVLALTDAYSMYSFMLRAYGVLSNYSILNRYTPNVLIEAMGLDYNDFRNNIADYRAGINQFAYALASFYLPVDIDIVKRRIFLYENVYMDANNSKAQYYMYNPYGFFTFVEADGSALTNLRLQPLNTTGNPLTVAELLDYAWNLITPLRASEDVRNITADLLKAFGTGHSVTVSPIAETYSISPVYNPEVLSQMENAFILPETADYSCNVTQNPTINEGYLQATTMCYYPNDQMRYYLNHNQAYYNLINQDYVILNSHESSPTPEWTMVATRLATQVRLQFDSTNPESYLYTIVNPSTEVVLGARIHVFRDTGMTRIYKWHTYMRVMATKSTNPQGADFEDVIGWSSYADMYQRNIINGILSKFDWHPRMLNVDQIDGEEYNEPNYYVASPSIDLDNFTIISNDEMDRLNTIAMLGLFTCTIPGAMVPQG